MEFVQRGREGVKPQIQFFWVLLNKQFLIGTRVVNTGVGFYVIQMC
jgi:uncharacterized membrane protein